MWSLFLTTVLTTVVGTFLYSIAKLRRTNKRIVSSKQDLERIRAIEQENEPGVYRSGMLLDTNVPIAQFDPEIATLYDVFMKGYQLEDGNARCLGYRPGLKKPYQYFTYQEVLEKARDFGSALIKTLHLKPGDESLIGIYAKNCPQWFISAFGCILQTITIVPLYDTFGPDAIAYILQQSQMMTIVIDTIAKAEKLLAKSEEFPSLKNIIVIEEKCVDKLRKDYQNVQIYTFNEILKEGHNDAAQMNLPKPQNTYIVCYTSGTTSFPKGVIISHRNIIANLSAFYLVLMKFSPDFLLLNKITTISYLPLSHMFEQMCHWFTFLLGGSTSYYSGNIQLLTEDLADIQPNLLAVVPRLLNRFYDLIQMKLKKANPMVRALFNYAYQKKLAMLKEGIICKDTIWDKLVFRQLQAKLGGNVQFMAIGSAPISAEVLEACRVTFGAVIIEGYGQTECTALATSTWPCDIVGGHCGGPSTCTLLKLADVPELNYFARERKGEIMLKGPSCTAGYFKDPQKTAELYDEDGFLHTGDIGEMLPNGTIRIIDRKKHIFKLAQGEYVAPEKIESVYTRAPCVQQIFVDGNSYERYLIAIVVPEEDVVKQWLKENVTSNGKSYEQLLQTKELQTYVLEQLIKIGKENNLNSIEQVKAVYLTNVAFSVENALLTPTLKTKRPQLRAVYAEVIKDLYKSLNGV